MKNSIFLIVTSVLNAMNPISVFAQANEWVFDKPYTMAGDWRIVAGSDLGDTCVAETDNAQVTLRIMYTEYTGDWYVGVPYYEGGSPMASVGPGDFTNDGIQMETWVVDGWAMHHFQNSDGMMKNLRGGSKFSIQLDRGLQTWSLKGSSKAMDLVLECAQNGGQNPTSNAANAAATEQPSAQNPVHPPKVQVTTVPPKGTKQQNAAALSAASTASATGGFGLCPTVGSVVSTDAGGKATAKFIDQTAGGKPKTIYWVDREGKHVEMGSIVSGSVIVNSHVGHKFLVKAVEGSCIGGAFEVMNGGSVFEIK